MTENEAIEEYKRLNVICREAYAKYKSAIANAPKNRPLPTFPKELKIVSNANHNRAMHIMFMDGMGWL